jgi:hypothetical protein
LIRSPLVLADIKGCDPAGKYRSAFAARFAMTVP